MVVAKPWITMPLNLPRAALRLGAVGLAGVLVACSGQISDPTGDPPPGTAPRCDVASVPEGPIRRLTRDQFDRTVRDLLGDTTAPARAFPPDDDTEGFYVGGLASNLFVEQEAMVAETLAEVAAAEITTPPERGSHGRVRVGDRSTLPGGHWRAQRGLGADSRGDNPDGIIHLSWGLTDRLQLSLPLPALAYRGGRRGALEWIPWAGSMGWGIGRSSLEGTIVQGTVGAGVDLRFWQNPRGSINLSIGASSEFRWTSRDPMVGLCTASRSCPDHEYSPDTWLGFASVGYEQLIGDRVSIAAGIYGERGLNHPSTGRRYATRIEAGSVQSRGLRRLPLVRIYVSDGFAVDGFGTVGYDVDREQADGRFVLGAAWFW